MCIVSPTEQIAFDQEFAQQRREFLKEACRLSLALGYDDPRQVIKTRDSIDADSIFGLDDTAAQMHECYPEWFGCDVIDAQYKLFDMLMAEYGQKVQTAESRRAAALKAWETMRRRKAGAK